MGLDADIQHDVDIDSVHEEDDAAVSFVEHLEEDQAEEDRNQ